jgi:L-arginine dehydrogenase
MSAVAPVPVLDAQAVAELMPSLTGLDGALADALRGLLDGGTVQPPQTLLPLSQGGDAIVYTAAVESLGVLGIKVSPYLPWRESPVTAWTLLVSTETGQPLLLCDSLALTTERTAATTALAVDRLAPEDAASLATIGAGKIAAAHLRHVLPLRSFTDVRVYSPSLAAGDPATVERIRAAAPQAMTASTAREAVEGVTVVLLCTSSGEPVIDVSWTAPDTLITSTTTNAPKAHEIAPAALPALAVYCDYRETAPLSAGEMVLAAEAAIWDPADIVADLPELLAGSSPSRPAGRAFFRSIGLGVEDAAVAAALLPVHSVD